ncbi:MAG: IS200/IS605 family transposase [Saprospiraceae bacterium]|nr:IS200/IS605 family transposase [Candidatus Opimibacter iunctus]
MANTFHQMYIQSVFAVKYRAAVIDKSWKQKLHGVIGNLINETGCKTIIINGVEDHVHCFFGLKPSTSVSSVMKNAKAKSSKWINESHLLENRFEWQEGFGAFTYSHAHIGDVFRYIENQEAHHQKQAFLKEYIQMLEEHQIEYDERYIFQELI